MPKSRRYMHGYRRRKSSCGHRSSFKFQDNRLTADEKAAGAVQIINGVACDAMGKPVGPTNPSNSAANYDAPMGRERFYGKPLRQTDNQKRLIEIKRQLNQLNKEGEYNKTEVEKESKIQKMNYGDIKPVYATVEGTGLDLISGLGPTSLLKSATKFFGKKGLMKLFE